MSDSINNNIGLNQIVNPSLAVESTQSGNSDQFNHLLSQEESSLSLRDQMISTSYKAIDAAKVINRQSNVPTVQASIDELEALTKELQGIFSQSDLVDPKKFKKLSENFDMLNPTGKRFSAISLTLMEGISNLDKLNESQKKEAKTLLQSIDKKMSSLVSEAKETDQLTNPFNGLQDLPFANPDMLSLQLQTNLIDSLLVNINSDGANSEPTSFSFLSNQGGNTSGQLPDVSQLGLAGIDSSGGLGG